VELRFVGKSVAHLLNDTVKKWCWTVYWIITLYWTIFTTNKPKCL